MNVNVSDTNDLLKVIPPQRPAGRSASVLRAAVSRLRGRILSSPSGHFLGYETELVEWLGVSRPTFRQAARLLEYEQFLVIKKGPGGGFYCRQPTPDSIVHLASVSLVAKRGRLTHMSQAAKPIFREIARLASGHPNVANREVLYKFCASSSDQIPMDGIGEFVRLTEEFTRALIELADNPVLEMFMGIVHQFASELRAHTGITKDDRQACLQIIDLLARAVIGGETDMAGMMADRMSEQMNRWQYENVESVYC